MTSKTVEVEVFVIVDSAGDTAQGDSAESARASYEENVQALADCDGFRMVRIVCDVPLPEVAVVELTASASALAEAEAAVA